MKLFAAFLGYDPYNTHTAIHNANPWGNAALRLDLDATPIVHPNGTPLVVPEAYDIEARKRFALTDDTLEIDEIAPLDVTMDDIWETRPTYARQLLLQQDLYRDAIEQVLGKAYELTIQPLTPEIVTWHSSAHAAEKAARMSPPITLKIPLPTDSLLQPGDEVTMSPEEAAAIFHEMLNTTPDGASCSICGCKFDLSQPQGYECACRDEDLPF